MQDKVLRQQVMHIEDEGMHVESWGFLAGRTNERPGSHALYYMPACRGMCSIIVCTYGTIGVSF